MISMRKQVFGLLVCTGIITILLTALFVNQTIHAEFKNYIETNIQKTSMKLVLKLAKTYEQYETWDGEVIEELTTETDIGNFSLAVLNKDKQIIWGMTEEEFLNKVKSLEYPLFYGNHLIDYKDMIYNVKDIPIETEEGIVGYARIGYFPSFLLSSNDIMFKTNINESIVVSGIIALFFLVGIGLYITKLFTKPIYTIAKTSEQLAEGNYKIRSVKHSRIKEVENLRFSMNYLAQKLEQQDTLRRKLISDVSHEIRTPLHILQSNLEAMIDGIYPIDDDQMQVLYQEVLRFGSLLNNLDKLKNIEEAIVEVETEEMHINTCIKEVYNTFKIVAKERGIKYRLSTQVTQHIVVLADHGALKQILMNILSNAFKFTRSGSISVKTHIKGKMIVICVEDTGIGIAKEDMPYIFERMYRGDKSREQFEGSGIGLTIVKKLVAQHGGKIDIESEEGTGTKVCIELPIHHVEKTSMMKILTLKE